MRDSMKRLIEEVGGTVSLGGALVQFSEESFERMFSQVYEAGMDQAMQICHEYATFKKSEDALNCAALIHNYIEQPDMESVSSGGSHETH